MILKKIDQPIRYLSLAILMFMWGFTAVHFSDLPTEIPIHFNARGIADGFGTRIHCWGLPILATIMAQLMHLLSKRKNIKKAEKQLLDYMQLLLVLLFGYIQIQVFFVAVGKSTGLGQWFLPLTMGLFLLPIIQVVAQQRRND